MAHSIPSGPRPGYGDYHPSSETPKWIGVLKSYWKAAVIKVFSINDHSRVNKILKGLQRNEIDSMTLVRFSSKHLTEMYNRLKDEHAIITIDMRKILEGAKQIYEEKEKSARAVTGKISKKQIFEHALMLVCPHAPALPKEIVLGASTESGIAAPNIGKDTVKESGSTLVVITKNVQALAAPSPPINANLEPKSSIKKIKPQEIVNKKDNEKISVMDFTSAPESIKLQLADIWPRRSKEWQSGRAPPEDHLLCYVVGEKLIGAVSLKKCEDEPNAFKLDVQIIQEFQEKGGYGRACFDLACKHITDQDGSIYLVDKARPGLGDQLYGGENTRSKFDVSILFHGDSGHTYHIQKKTSAKTMPLLYIKIRDLAQKGSLIFNALNSASGMRHLYNYMALYPEDRYLLDDKFYEKLQKTREEKKNYLQAEVFKEYDSIASDLCGFRKK